MEKHPSEVPEDESGADAASQPPLVRLALVFYVVLFGVALLWARLMGESLFYATPEAALRGVDLWRDVAVGALAGAIVILVSRWFTERTGWGEALARALGALLGRRSVAACVALALVSGVGEEAFFRGALQPRVGIVVASVLFALAHFVPSRDFALWTLFSLAAGFLLGVLFTATGNLVAPVVAHALINAVNLRYLSVRYAGGTGTNPPIQ